MVNDTGERTKFEDFDPSGNPAPVPAPPKASQSFWRRMLVNLVQVFLTVLVALIIVALARAFIFQIFRVPSGSMEQTLQLRDRIAAVRVADWSRGDVVVFEDKNNWLGGPQITTSPFLRGLEKIGLLPNSEHSYLVKRVIGLPGDNVKCCSPNGKLTVNGKELTEDDYLYRNPDGSRVAPSEISFDVTVPADHIFVMGDHRDRSGDSRIHMCEVSAQGTGWAGFIPQDAVVGPVKAVVLPFNRTHGLTRPATFADIPDPTEPAPEAPVLSGNTCK